MTFILRIPRRRRTLLIGIDGFGGSGKSTFAGRIKENIRGTQIVPMDDFFDGNHIIWPRVVEEILEPLSRDKSARYQPYQSHSNQLGEWREIEVGGIVIVEGILSLKPELAEFYDFKIWLDCPREIRLERGIARDGEQWREKWINEWMPREEHYFLHELPAERADLILRGS